MIVFKVAPDYSIAHDLSGNDCICLSEWSGKTFEQFRDAMGRKPDAVHSTRICGRKITEYIWNK